MKLISFSVENFRSITTARKIPLSDYSLLVGANNEGKSNILHALAFAMNALEEWQRHIRETSDGRLLAPQPRSFISRHERLHYDWNTDYPVSKQGSATNTSATKIILEFNLDSKEIDEFQEEIGSNLNGTLPLEVSFSQSRPKISVKKQGRGQATLNKKSTRIAYFISRRIRFEYIPAIRTAESATRIISELVERELAVLEKNAEYNDAISKIEILQKPIFDELAEAIQSTVESFLPNVKLVELKSQREVRYRTLRRGIDIVIDDGQLTKLERKGDGVQSLVALALMRHASEQNMPSISSVVAIEEPESHLHPSAVHELKTVIAKLAATNQVVLTSHSPLFVSPKYLENTIIVKGSKAAPASHVSQIRDTLGVRFSDNLQSARMVLLVEGSDDALALGKIISIRSQVIAQALEDGTLALDHLGGASGLRQKASFYSNGACMIQCFIDDDKAGRLAVDRALDDKVLDIIDVNLCSVPEPREAELEDLYDRNLYRQEFLDEFGVDPKFKPRGGRMHKWSIDMERLFRERGKPWNKAVKERVKDWLARYAVENADRIVLEALEGPLVNFIGTIELKLASLK